MGNIRTSLRLLIITVLVLGTWASTSLANNIPPTPTNSFYGDATGDTIIDASDIAQMRSWTLGLTYSYDTIQPAAPTQSWNTSDVTSDNLIDASDLGAIKSWTLGLNVSIPDKPWVLFNETLPASIAVNTPTSFKINLASTVGTQFGRTGIPIIANIDAANSTATGSLGGRTCTPIAGSRDQSSTAGDQCALSVTVTDWYGASGPTKGLTESGTYGFSVTGTSTGNLRIIFSISGNPPGLDIPAASIALNIGISGGGGGDQIDINCQGSVNEMDSISCSVVTASGLGLCSVGAGDTCGGSIDSACVGPYMAPAPGEAAGPGSCIAKVTKGSASDTHTINILEQNQNPTISLVCPAQVDEDKSTSCSITVSDDDLPPQNLTCSLGAGTCTGVSLNGCTSVNIAAQGEAAGPGSCSVSVIVQDDFSPSGSNQASASIEIKEVNQSPMIMVNCPASVDEDKSTSCALIAMDADLPPQPLTCTLSGGPVVCTGVTLNGCTSANVPAQGEMKGSTSCSIYVFVSDGIVPPGWVSGADSIIINEVNLNPLWNPPPFPIQVNTNQSYSQNDGHATDADFPNSNISDPGYLTCAKQSQTCSFPVSVSGSGNGAVNCHVSFTAGPDLEDCSVDIQVLDGWSPAGTINGVIGISVSADPTVSIDCSNPGPNPVDELSSMQCTVLATYGIPSINGATDTCGGSLSGSDPWYYNYTPGEEDGPGFCVAGVINDTAIASDVITINEVNQNPSIIVDCPSEVDEDKATTCVLTASDLDTPPQLLTCSVNIAGTCMGVTLNGCVSASVSPQGEQNGPGSCTLVVDVSDNFFPIPGNAQGSDTMIINEVNQPPVWDPISNNIKVRTNFLYDVANGVAKDEDWPNTLTSDPGYLTCVDTGQTCSFSITVTGTGNGAVPCKLTFTTGDTEEECDLDIEVSDGYNATIQAHVDISVAPPSTIYVDADAAGANNGSSWADAFTVIQDGMDEAISGCQVWVAEGTYYRPIGGNEPVLTMREGVEIYGGFVGTEFDLSERGDPNDHPTILDGQYSSNIVVIGDSDARLDGFTVRSNRSVLELAHGMHNKYVTGLWVENCDFTDNSSSFTVTGGAMSNEFSSLTITNCSFSNNNNMAVLGGAVYNGNSSVTVTYCSFANNDSSGMVNEQSSGIISNSTFSNNGGETLTTSVPYGGGMRNVDCVSLTIADCTFSNNLAFNGGGMFNSLSSSLTITGCIFDGNMACTYGGGGMANLGSSPIISYCSFENNFATGFYQPPFFYFLGGGGIINNSSFPAIDNTDFINNSTYCYGGGIFNSRDSGAYLTNCTFSGNTAGIAGKRYLPGTVTP